MNGLNRRRSPAPLVRAAVLISAVLIAQPATASNIPLAFIGPHQYDLPSRFKPFGGFVQYFSWNHDSQRYDALGHRVAGPGTDQFFFVEQYAYFFVLPFLRSVGWAAGVLLPLIVTQGPRLNISGIGDPLLGAAAWIKPSRSSTLGFQSFLLIPIGANEISTHYWLNISTVLFDWNFSRFNLDGDAGGIFRATRHITNQPDVDQGTSFFLNLRLSYRLHKRFQPFVGLDYEIRSSNRDTLTHQIIPDSDQHETGWGAGLLTQVNKKIDLSARYEGSFAGKNTIVTKAIFGRLTLSW
jgi:opacity protein-like surface antigen